MDISLITEQKNLAGLIIKKAREKNKRLAIAESCTGGMISSILTSIPGASDVFDQGLVTYSNKSKIIMLGVKESSIKNFGAVSKEVAIEMVEGLLLDTDLNIALSISGVAGPGSLSYNKPAGLVWIAYGNQKKTIKTLKLNLGNIGRDLVRQKSCIEALNLLLKSLDNY